MANTGTLPTAEIQSALHEVESLLQRRHEGFPLVSEEISRASRSLIALRNRLIAQQRSGGTARASAQLHQANSLLSVMSSIEYPLAGVHWSRIEKVRDGLKQLAGGALH